MASGGKKQKHGKRAGHHYFPRSRFRVDKPDRDYHRVFGNRIAEEAIEQVMEWGGERGVISEAFLSDKPAKFRQAFVNLFGGERRVRALCATIQHDWAPPGIRVILNRDEIRRALRKRKDLLGFEPIDTDDTEEVR